MVYVLQVDVRSVLLGHSNGPKITEKKLKTSFTSLSSTLKIPNYHPIIKYHIKPS